MLTSPDSRPYSLDAPAPASSPRSPAALTTTAWSPCMELTVADWARQGRWLGALGRGSGWWIGDWVRYGNARYGDRYGAAARVTGYDAQSLRNMAYVAGRFDVPRRRGGLSFSHHAELAGLPAAQQDLWLDRAEAGTLSVSSLRSELRQARHRAASRAALAEARRERDRPVLAAQSKAATRGSDVEPPMFANPSPAGPAGASAGFPSGDEQPAASRWEAVVVCPECGHHFAPTADSEVPDSRRPGEGPGERRPRLSLARGRSISNPLRSI
jgi:hypothetical protein